MQHPFTQNRTEPAPRKSLSRELAKLGYLRKSAEHVLPNIILLLGRKVLYLLDLNAEFSALNAEFPLQASATRETLVVTRLEPVSSRP